MGVSACLTSMVGALNCNFVAALWLERDFDWLAQFHCPDPLSLDLLSAESLPLQLAFGFEGSVKHKS
jgi:hypothetical protein